MSNQQHQEDSYRYGGQGFSGVPGGVVVDPGSGGFGGQKYAKQGQQGAGAAQEHTHPAHDDSAYRYGGQGFSGVPGGVVVDPGSGGFGGQKFAKQGQQGQQGAAQEHTHPAHDDSGYRYGGQGFSGVPGGVAIEAGSGGFGGERYHTPPVGGAASDGASHHHSHHHASGGDAAQGSVAPGTGHAHHKHEHHDEERR